MLKEKLILSNGRDPWIVKNNDTYLMIESVNNDREIAIRSFKDINHLEQTKCLIVIF